MNFQIGTYITIKSEESFYNGWVGVIAAVTKNNVLIKFKSGQRAVVNKKICRESSPTEIVQAILE